MKVTNEIRIQRVDNRDTQIGDGARLLVMSTQDRRRGVAIQLFNSNSEAPGKLIVVDGDELRDAVDNAQRGG